MLTVILFTVSVFGLPLGLELCSISMGMKCSCESGCCSTDPASEQDSGVLTGPKCCTDIQPANGHQEEFISAKSGVTETVRTEALAAVASPAIMPVTPIVSRVPHPVARSGVLDVSVPVLVSSLRI